MAMIETMKKMIFTSMKNGDVIAKDVLRVVVSDIEAAAQGKPVTDDLCFKTMRKIIANNSEVISKTTNEANKAKLLTENAIMSALLPTMLSQGDIEAAIRSRPELMSALFAAKSVGQATGAVMKEFKGMAVNGQDVTAVVAKIIALARMDTANSA